MSRTIKGIEKLNISQLDRYLDTLYRQLKTERDIHPRRKEAIETRQEVTNLIYERRLVGADQL